MPTMITAATTSSLSATTIWLILLESLIPQISTIITSSEITTAGRLMMPFSADAREAGTSNAVPASSSWR